MRQFRNLLADKRGATAIEYALIAVLVSVAAMISFGNLGTGVQNSFGNIEENLEGAL